MIDTIKKILSFFYTPKIPKRSKCILFTEQNTLIFLFIVLFSSIYTDQLGFLFSLNIFSPNSYRYTKFRFAKNNEIQTQTVLAAIVSTVNRAFLISYVPLETNTKINLLIILNESGIWTCFCLCSVDSVNSEMLIFNNHIVT